MSDTFKAASRAPLLLARASTMVLIALALAQAILAGNFLGGQYDALGLHALGARAITITSAVQIARNNKPPGNYDHGWKDTVDIAPSEAVEIIVRFTDYQGTYLVHCHNLEHEDMAMMADFVTAR
jgi:FtsP/CotA-like multicopper oxidase with cupredoxin domain